MQRLFEAMIQRQLNRLLVCPAKSLLSQRAFCSVRDEMEKQAAQMRESGCQDGGEIGLPRALHHLETMSEADEALDLSLLRRGLLQ